MNVSIVHFAILNANKYVIAGQRIVQHYFKYILLLAKLISLPVKLAVQCTLYSVQVKENTCCYELFCKAKLHEERLITLKLCSSPRNCASQCLEFKLWKSWFGATSQKVGHPQMQRLTFLVVKSDHWNKML